MEDFLEDHGVKTFTNFYYHPQNNPTERVNRVFKSMIVSYVVDNQRLWDRHLHHMDAINTSKHEATWFSPHQLMFGERRKGHGTMTPVVEGDAPVSFGDSEDSLGKWQDKLKVQAELIKRLEAAYTKNSKSYNLRRPVDLTVGQTVYRRNYTQSKAGDTPQFVGPFKIYKKVRYKAYLLESSDGSKDGPWHVSKLKPKADVELVEKRTLMKFCSW
ncbi:hypothetical protein FOCC_FOCC013422, partial [Frankliniella occidentalis]